MDARNKGFTLIEMSIVLVVIGLIIGGSIAAVTPILQSSKATETKGRIDAIEAALQVYAIRFSCLPCPAADNSATGIAQFVGLANGCGTSCTADFGAVPWATLGIARSEISDAWNNRIRYHVTPALVVANSMNRDGTNYAPLGGLTVRERDNDAALGVVTTEAAYVLVSHGRNGGYGFNVESGIQRPGDATHTDETENSNADVNYVQGQNIAIEGATYFDDFVTFRSKPILVQMCGDGACGNPG
jgi:prepilin-type N-terminal cleavage/methylation domain-containing protein